MLEKHWNSYWKGCYVKQNPIFTQVWISSLVNKALQEYAQQTQMLSWLYEEKYNAVMALNISVIQIGCFWFAAELWFWFWAIAVILCLVLVL